MTGLILWPQDVSHGLQGCVIRIRDLVQENYSRDWENAMDVNEAMFAKTSTYKSPGE